MLKDLIGGKMNQLSFSGVAIDLVKEYAAKLSSEESFVLHHPVMLLMKSGRFKMRTGESIQDLKKHDLLMLPPKISCRAVEWEDGPQFYVIGLSASRMNRGSNFHYTDSLFYRSVREAIKIGLDVKDYKVLSLICRLLYKEGDRTEPADFDRELCRMSADLLFFEMKLIHSKYFSLAALHASRGERLSLQFLAVLAIHCRKHHSVKFYAGALYVTSGYLNRVVKEITGKSAKKTIIEAVLVQAVNLLQDSNFTIAEIAEELEFSSLSAFDIFFKKLMFCTPSEYRSKCP
ncbi:helix-turn-helix domain-containing protein [Flavobacterium sp. KACC 22763]|uniref:helix-turn-helix domain-containing protein n=1 Tax=Flavobacterium sp. KACC 22763 TaxID=3025668 RepID=UPI002365117E|nr:AraC family transcriptional regulator [Flavobacterium sp. KACC 22763]WDF66102.1 AraC family transcriptional regulator [Flavobacterium sp. KACC 22763]